MSDYKPPTPQQLVAMNRVYKPSTAQVQKAFRKDAAAVHRQQQEFSGARLDGYANVMAGLGGTMDKRRYTYFDALPIIPDVELERMYFGDGIGSRCVDAMPDDMTREWIEIKEADQEDETFTSDAVTKLEEVFSALDVQGAYNEALKWASLYGGSAIVLGALDGQTLDKPLNPSRITGIDYLKVVDRTDIDLFQSIYQMDPTKPGYGKPLILYMYFQVGAFRYPQMVHVSRVQLFRGKKVPQGASSTTTIVQRFWGLSSLNAWYDALKDFATMTDSVTNVMLEFLVGKYKMKGLADLLSVPGGDKLVQDKMQLISLMKSVIHGVMLDAEAEDYTRDSASLGGVADVIDRGALKVCAVTGYPYARLFGDSPSGLSTDDESGRRSYYDQVRSAQNTRMRPQLTELISIVCQWLKLPDMTFDFRALEQMDSKQEAEIESSKATAMSATATAYKTYVDMGALSGQEVRALVWKEQLEGVEVEEYEPSEDEIAEAAAAQLESEDEQEED